MILKLGISASGIWKRPRGFHWLAKVIEGARFRDGVATHEKDTRTGVFKRSLGPRFHHSSNEMPRRVALLALILAVAEAAYAGEIQSIRELEPAARLRLAEQANAKRGIIISREVEEAMLRSMEGKFSWFYTYSLHPRGFYDWANRVGVEFVPMLWGGTVVREDGTKCDLPGPDGSARREGAPEQAVKPRPEFRRQLPAYGPLCKGGADEIRAVLSTVISRLRVKPRYLLGFNEPWGSNQSNLSPREAAWMWGQYVQPVAKALNLTLVSPTVAVHRKAKRWFADFLKACHDEPLCDPESIGRLSIHSYHCQDATWVREFSSRLQHFDRELGSLLQKYGDVEWGRFLAARPIWVTETNCNHEFERTEPVRSSTDTCLRMTGQKNDSRWRAGSLMLFVTLSRIERFSWWTTYSADARGEVVMAKLVNASGDLTPAGKAFFDFPNVNHETCAIHE
ncbi:MAG TPA: glycosyl hydrolase [Burkholderiales bacterium]|nr:glycosyl hydrolase [Burkholderiales bacterium]